MFVSFSNFGDNSFSNEKQSKDGDNESADSEPRKLNESHDSGDQSGSGSANEPNESVAVASNKTLNEERTLPRIQIKSPSKLAQEFSEKQKQQSDMMSSSNESNRTNNNKSSVDLNTTPLYDEPTENPPYSIKEPPSSHSFDSQNHEAFSSSDTNAVNAAEVTDNCEH